MITFEDSTSAEGGLSFTGGIVDQSGKFMIAILREEYTGQVITLNFLKTRPVIENNETIEDIAVLKFDEFSNKPIKREEMIIGNDNIDDAFKSVSFHFEQDEHVFFLTRC